jgi:hypothetical protein
MLLFQPVPEGKSAKNRVHLDVRPSGTQREEVDRLVALGARVLSESTDLPWSAMKDPEGNEFCVLGTRQGSSGARWRVTRGAACLERRLTDVERQERRLPGIRCASSCAAAVTRVFSRCARSDSSVVTRLAATANAATPADARLTMIWDST